MTNESRAAKRAAGAVSQHADRSIRLATPAADEAFTGERFMPGYRDGSVELEHIHRYCTALPLAEGRKVLDIACGEGYGVDLLAQVAARAVGIDLDERIVQRASLRYARANVEFKQGSVADIPSGDGEFDLVVCFETIEHVAEQARVLSELKRVLSSNGILAISTPDSAVYGAGGAEHNHFHVKELSFPEFEALLCGRFKNVAFCKQEVVFGSLILSPVGTARAAEELSVLRLDQATGLIAASPLGKDIGEYIIALASDGDLPNLLPSLYAGDYPRKPISALAGGILERDTIIGGLRQDLAEAEVKNGVLAGGISERDAAIAELRQQAGILREELDERMRSLRAMRQQLSEASARFAERLADFRRSAEPVDSGAASPTSGAPAPGTDRGNAG
jgi:2-polyprenyl-3-methyl-5-hydroxy-6-metoxy-1,4-benzoquinol methylase